MTLCNFWTLTYCNLLIRTHMCAHRGLQYVNVQKFCVNVIFGWALKNNSTWPIDKFMSKISKNNWLMRFWTFNCRWNFGTFLWFVKVFERHKGFIKFIPLMSRSLHRLTNRVYSSTNQTPFTGSQNSILNWVFKFNPLNQKNKKGNKKLFRPFGESLILEVA